MLASIHPLGERARRSRWWITVAAYVVGSTAGGAAFGAGSGGVGDLLLRSAAGWSRGPALPPLAVAAVCLAAAVGDAGVLSRRIPRGHRQVDEDWLHRYRGWVYGAGYGFQLGLGVVTIVTTTSVYAVAALAFLSRSVVVGTAIGALFGLVRATPLLAGWGVQRPDQLRRLHGRLAAAAGPARRLASSALIVAAAAAGAAAWGGR